MVLLSKTYYPLSTASAKQVMKRKEHMGLCLVPITAPSKALYWVLCREVFAKALLIYHFVDISEAYSFFLHLCTEHVLDCHCFCGLSWSVELYGRKSGPLSSGIWRRCFKTRASKSLSGFFPTKSGCLQTLP